MFDLRLGDCIAALRTLPDHSVDSVVTDPPYHLTTDKKGGSGPASVNLNTPHAHARVGTGFMGMTWDGGDIAFRTDVWLECLRVLKPGGHLLAFGGSRTYHRLACAVEDAGFDIRDQIMWIYGSGFPKASNLKPAHEPIVVARKPFKGSAEANVARWGVGELNVDLCRVPNFVPHAAFSSLAPCSGNALGQAGTAEARRGTQGEPREYVGRWPANLIHDGSEEVLAAFPDAPGQQGDVSDSAPSSKTSNVYGAMRRVGEPSQGSENGGVVGFKMRPGARRLDTGSAARFFYCAKASKSDREDGNTHPTVKPTTLMCYLLRLVTPPGGVTLDPFMGSGSTGKAAMLEGFQFIGMERDEHSHLTAQNRITRAWLESLK